MHERAINLPRLHAAILKEENGSGGIEGPGCAERGLNKIHAAAEDNSFGEAAENRLTLQIQFPRRCRAGNRRFERRLVIALWSVGTGVETGGDHGAIDTGPMKFLPEKNLQRGNVAVADDAFGRQRSFEP